MPFPCTIESETFAEPKALMARVQSDLSEGGGTLVADQRPSEWLMKAPEPTLDRGELIALAAALVVDPSPSAVAEGALLARALHEPRLGALLMGALAGLDLGVLLAPGANGSSVAVEDLVMETIVEIADLSEDNVRHALLTALRTAGRTDLELRTLTAYGSLDDIEQTRHGLEAEGVNLSPEDDDALKARQASLTHPDGSQTTPRPI